MASIRRKNDKWQAVIRRAGEAKRKALGPVQHQYFNYIEQFPGCTQADIISTFHADKGQVSRVISRLLELGMVRKAGEYGNQLHAIH